MPTLSPQYPGPFKARATNSTDSAFPSRVAQTASPLLNDGAFSVENYPIWLSLVPFGVGANNTTFDVRVIGWRKYGNTADVGGTLWMPRTLLQFSVTLSAAVGVAGTEVDETQRFADTLSDPVTGMGTIGVNCQPTSPANDTEGHYLFDRQGHPVLEILFDMTGATSGNCLVEMI